MRLAHSLPADQDVFQFARKMLQIFALALSLDENDLDETFRYPLNDITMQYYPIQDLNEQSSISPHADYGGKSLELSVLFHVQLIGPQASLSSIKVRSLEYSL